MEAAHMHNSPSEVTGHPAENALDNNPDTYWQPTSTNIQYFDIDLGSAKTVGCVLLFVKNYKTFGDSPAAIGCYWSDNGSSWNGISNFPTVKDISTPIRINTTSFGSSHRYWRIAILDQDEVIKLAGIWWGSYYNIAQGNEYPEADADRFYNRAAQLPGGRLGIVGINKNSSRLISRQYLFSRLTEFNELRSAFLDSAGRRVPLVLNEGSAQSDALLVRFANDEFAENETDYQLFQPSVSFIELPYIDDGDSY